MWALPGPPAITAAQKSTQGFFRLMNSDLKNKAKKKAELNMDDYRPPNQRGS